MNTPQKYSCPVVEDSDGYLCIEFSDEILNYLDLKIGDVLEWEHSTNGSFILNKTGEKNEEK